MTLSIKGFGQVGYLFENEGTRVIVDPYLSDFVAEKYGSHLLRPVAHQVEDHELTNIGTLLLTHAHEDHCDPITIQRLIDLNMGLKIFGSYDCREVFKNYGIGLENFEVAEVGCSIVIQGLVITPVLAAHTQIEINPEGKSRYLGFLIRIGHLSLYHAGDTIPHDQISKCLPQDIDYAFLPINERNYFRDREGIVGNMSCREALQWAKELGVKNLVPTHWDTFEPNSAHKEELEFLFEKGKFDFNLQWIDFGQTINI